MGCKKDTLKWKSVETLDAHTTHNLYNILFTNSTDGYIVGGDRFLNATVLTTTDGGDTWKYQDLPEAGKCIYGICQSPWGAVYACGFESKLLHTTDAGSTWTFKQMDNWKPCKDMTFNNNHTGIVIGGASFNYGCVTYIDSLGNISRFDTLQYELNDIEMRDGRIGYIAGFGAILKTTDGGNTWTVQNAVNDDFMAITTINDDELWACGINGSILHTTDGGVNWTKQRNGNDILLSRYRLLDVTFKDSKNGYAVGEKGVVIYTDDGGEHWMEYDRFTDKALRSIYILPDSRLLIAGDGGSLYKVSIK